MSRPLRVALLSSFHERCGIATYSESLVPELERAGARVRVLAPKLRRGEHGIGEQPPRLWHRNRAFGFEALRVAREIGEFAADVVQLQVNLSLFSSRFLWSLARLLEREKIPLVATLHGRRGGSWGRDFKLWRMDRALRGATLIVHNEAHRGELAAADVRVIAHGIDRVSPRPMLEARRAIGLEANGPVLAHFGFLVPDKGVLEVLHAVRALRDGRFPGLRYWISGAVFGSEESRAYLRTLQDAVRQLGLEEHVHLSGEFVPEARALEEMQAADWIVLNYRSGNNQGASGALRRALASGRPVAVSSAAVFDDARDATWTLSEPLAGSLATMLADAPLAQRVAESARAYCEASAWPRVAEQHVALYEELLARRGVRAG